jgi:hypothetical protein
MANTTCVPAAYAGFHHSAAEEQEAIQKKCEVAEGGWARRFTLVWIDTARDFAEL